MSEEKGGADSLRETVAKRKELTDFFVYKLFDTPVTWFNDNIVEKFQSKNKYPYYHRRFRRVPTVDTCAVDDMACVFEAEEQYRRDKKVDANIVRILRQRYTECQYYERNDAPRKCKEIAQQYLDESTNFFIKYGDLGRNSTVVDALMKQKHRMLWERRHPKKEVE